MTKPLRITLQPYLVEAIAKYNATDWSDGRDPSKLGALNAVAYIGEHVAAHVKLHQPRKRRSKR